MRNIVCNRVWFIVTVISVFVFKNAAAQPTLMSACPYGGQQFGTIYTYTAGNTTMDTVYQLEGIAGSRSEFNRFVEYGNKLYGMTYSGGIYSEGSYEGGTIYSYDYATNTIATLYNFNEVDGKNPRASLTIAANGKMYGTTSAGGSSDLGVIFEFNPVNNSYTKKYNFSTGNSGNTPVGTLVAIFGKLYGCTYSGGVNNKGVIFEYNITTQAYTVLHHFTDSSGSRSFGSLMLASNNLLYGVTMEGGQNGNGVIYSFNTATSVYTNLISLSAITTGYRAAGPMTELNPGKLFGLTYDGGTTGGGAFFEYDISTNTILKKHDFIVATGYDPYGSLFKASNGNIYGFTTAGGANNSGVIFNYDSISGSYTKFHDFTYSEGTHPHSTFMEASNGKLYAATKQGGLDFGTIIELDPVTDSLIKKIEFGTANGSNCFGTLVQTTDHRIFGMTQVGGENGMGGIFEYAYSTGTFTNKYNFSMPAGFITDGYMMEASNGKLYGVTTGGGTTDDGTLFEYDYINDLYVKKHDFILSAGRSPITGLVEAPNGKLYGMTNLGGAAASGTIYEYNYTNNVFTKKIDLTQANGRYPRGALFLASNGKMYGMTQWGGTWDAGVIFEYNYLTNTYTKLVDFTNTNGAGPYGSFIEGSNGKLYAFTNLGGSTNQGTLIEYNYITGTLTVKKHFDGINGEYPKSTLVKASNNKMYGQTPGGGTYGGGVLFEYDYLSNTFTKKVNLQPSGTGFRPFYNSLIEVGCISPVIEALGPISFCQGGSVTLNCTSDPISNFQWKRNGNIIPGATNPQYIATIAGTYIVEVSDAVCTTPLNSNFIKVRIPCIPPFDEEQKIAEGNNNTVESFDAWFNADNKELNIASSGVAGDQYQLIIYDGTGRQLFDEQGSFHNDEFNSIINCSSYAEGIYFVKFLSDNQQRFKKFKR